MRRTKTHEYPDEDGDFYGNIRHLSPPDFTKSPLIINRKIDVNPHHFKKTIKKSPSSSLYDQTAGNKPGKWSLGSLMAALLLSPSPVCSTTQSGSHSHSHSSSLSPLRGDFSRASAEFYTPTHHSSSVVSSISFRKQDQSPKCMSMSTLYESAIDQGYRFGGNRDVNALQNYIYDRELSTATAEIDNSRVSCPVLPCVPEERGYFVRAEPVMIEEDEPPVNRPKPYQEFLDEVEKHKHRAEIDAWKKAAYTDLLNKLKRKEADIDCWESSQRSKAEFKLDRIERKLDKKRAKAAQKMHQKIAEAKMEAERGKARERRSALKEMAKLSHNTDIKKPTSAILCFP